MHKLKEILRNQRHYLWLLPLFFAFHGFVSYAKLALYREAFFIFAGYTLLSIILAAIASKLLHDKRKGGAFAFSLTGFQFFFGSIQDFLKQHLPHFFSSYSFLILLTLVAFILFFIFLNRTNSGLKKFTSYLNLLLLVLLMVDLITLVSKSGQPRLSVATAPAFAKCNDCPRPDIYLIIADEYAGDKELQDIFGFDNSGFENALAQKGFHLVKNSRSNYNATLYSMASMLNMDYLQHLENKQVNNQDQFLCRDLIYKSHFLSFLKNRGYNFYNNSFFDLPGSKAGISNIFFPTRYSLFLAQTFTSRVTHDLGFHFVTEQQLEATRRHMQRMNEKADSQTRRDAALPSASPKFVYTHLTLPHHPYYFDSSGVQLPSSKLEDRFKLDKQAYISYLVYANKKLSALIDAIISSSSQPPVILLMGDHGFRQFVPEADHSYYFMNMNAVLLPGRNYSGFYEGMSNVNELKVVLNTVFGQSLPLKKDSTIFLWE
jgi:hypothetical protein